MQTTRFGPWSWCCRIIVFFSFFFFPLSVFLLNVEVSFCEPLWAKIPKFLILFLNREGFFVPVDHLQAISRLGPCDSYDPSADLLSLPSFRKISPLLFVFSPQFMCYAVFEISVRKTWQLWSVNKFPLSHGFYLFRHLYLMLSDWEEQWMFQ